MQGLSMKQIYKIKIVLLLLALASVPNLKADDTISHSFFSVRPQFRNFMYYIFFRPGWMSKREEPWGTAVQVIGYGSSSTNPESLARYFMPYNRQCLQVMEYKSTVPSSQNDTERVFKVEARHFNIQTQSLTETFQSKICFAPEQKVKGICIGFKQAFWWFENNNPRIWLDLIVPIEKVTNRMGLCETVENTGGGASPTLGLDNAPHVGNMIEAFKQSNWKYGKIDANHDRSTSGVADVEIRINWSSKCNEWFRTVSYVGGLIPTGTYINAKQAAFVFNPVVGNNRHWALTYGSNIDVTCWDRDEHEIRFLWDVNSAIVVSNYQVRSFDLDDKQWSRYMEVYRTEADAQAAQADGSMSSGTSGINVFTKCLKVDPRYAASMTASLAYEHPNWHVIAGYNLYARHAEDLNLYNWTEHIALKAVTGQGATTLARNIGQNFVGSNITDPVDFTDALVGISNINLNSAAHPGIISHTLFSGARYDTTLCGIPVFIGAGASYEFSSISAVMNRWTAWGTLGLSL
jgi:hypothetical protein